MVEPIYDTACGDMGEPIHDSDMGREKKYLISWFQQVQVLSTAMNRQV